MKKRKTPTEELDRMISEAVVDAYDDYKQVMGKVSFVSFFSDV